jgi:hypothetical protein
VLYDYGLRAEHDLFHQQANDFAFLFDWELSCVFLQAVEECFDVVAKLHVFFLLHGIEFQPAELLFYRLLTLPDLGDALAQFGQREQVLLVGVKQFVYCRSDPSQLFAKGLLSSVDGRTGARLLHPTFYLLTDQSGIFQ